MSLDLFARPSWLWLLLALLPLGALAVRETKRRQTAWSALGQDGWPGAAGAWSWLGALGCLVLALGQPRWGRSPGSALPPGHDVVLAIDTSWSMAAEDAVPNRLGVAVEAAESLVSALGRSAGSRAAVVAFAGRGVVRCPLTENLGAAADALRSLRLGDVQPGGTDLGGALEAALDAFDQDDHEEGRSIVVVSDGEDHARSWPAIVPKAVAAGVAVHAVAIGDPQRGHPIPLAAERGDRVLKFQGEAVLTRRSDEALDKIARDTGGALVPLGLAATDLGQLYETRIAPVARARREALRPPERRERYGLFALAALGLALAGAWPRGRRLVRRRWPVVPILAAGLVALGLGAGQGPGTTAQAVSDGIQAYRSAHYTNALAAFAKAIELAPADPLPRYDAAAALYQLGQLDAALARYGEARARADAGLQTKIDYAMGNTALRLGRIDEAIAHYDRCLASRVAGRQYDAVRLDAAINRRFAQDLARARSGQEAKGGTAAQEAARKSQQRKGGQASPTPMPDEPKSAEVAAGSPSGQRGPGGAGGTGSHQPRPGSPEARLAAALENIRDARRRRIEETPPVPAEAESRKDW